MNKIRFELEKVDDISIIREGISFTNIAFINPIVDGKSLFEEEDFEDSFMVYDELIRSSKHSGKYLLFTCACGVADDGGWNGIDVVITPTTISWKIDRNIRILNFIFNTTQFNSELEKLIKKISNLTQKYTIVPKNVDFPEEW